MSLAIFILPIDPLKTELEGWKERVNKELPNQPYALHPPHMTLINIEVLNENEAIGVISSISKNINPFQISVISKNLFWNDTATGGHTMFYCVERNEALFNLQQSLAKSLQEMKKTIQPPKNLTKDKNYLKSFEKYGFPFVGNHWVPHFSVASLQTKKTDIIINDFLQNNKRYDFMVNKFSIWRIDGDQHTKLKTLKLK
jgi:2'-5' RNA ligase